MHRAELNDTALTNAIKAMDMFRKGTPQSGTPSTNPFKAPHKPFLSRQSMQTIPPAIQ